MIEVSVEIIAPGNIPAKTPGSMSHEDNGVDTMMVCIVTPGLTDKDGNTN